MRCSPLVVATAVVLAAAACDPALETPSLIPVPETVVLRAGSFRLQPGARIVVSDPADPELVRMSELVAMEVARATGLHISAGGDGESAVRLVMDPALEVEPAASGSPLAREESYVLTSGPEGIAIRSTTHAGLFYGTRTLLQLLPPEVADPAPGEIEIPGLEIRDRPRFVYRGLHLDVGRHYFPPEFIKRYIDLLARYKLNVFHWHLTEDQGWRLEIERYPRLAEVGSRRAETILEKNFDPYVGDGIPYGGYYTQDEVRDIVAYAAERYVTVIPEIEMPGHSVAALAAYPELACTPGPFEVSTVWGVKEDIYCPRETTFEFLEGVLTETMELFPSPYIHIGGDEAPKTRWEESPVAQEVMRREGLADEYELQSWFIQRIERFLLENDRRIIGWDEILEGGLAPQATVMSWRGVEGGIEAARQGHDVVMTPTSHMYFDYYQGDRDSEPLAIGGYLPLERVYSYEPVPPELTEEEQRHVLGAQGNVWTEYMKTPGHVEYMAYPRVLALAELTWSPAVARDWDGFARRLPAELARLEALGVNYRIPEPAGLADRLTLSDTVHVELRNPLGRGSIHYTLDGAQPTAASPVYEAPLQLAVDTSWLTISARVIHPGGRAGPVARATYARTVLRTGLDIDSARLRPGLALEYVEGDFSSTRGVEAAETEHTGMIPAVELPGIEREEGFGLRFRGYLRVPFDDLYTFEITSDDGSQLYVEEEIVIDHDGYHSATPASGTIGLSKGHHRFRVTYFQAGGGRELSLRVSRGGEPLERVPDGWYFVEDPLAPKIVLPMTDAP